MAPMLKTKPGDYITLKDWAAMDVAERAAVLAKRSSLGFIKQKSTSIEWARWSWNPVTGCLNICKYCYARPLAKRLYPEGFAPVLWPSRLDAPRRRKVPAAAARNIGEKSVFVCSMADLFGNWVPRAWINDVLETARETPDWNFIFLTKYPHRLAEFDFPDNAWVGTSIDKQSRVANAEAAFEKVNAKVKWLSCEPMEERLTFSRLGLFDWVVVGGKSKTTQNPAFLPPEEWINHLEAQAREAGCMVYEKDNLRADLHDRTRDYPER